MKRQSTEWEKYLQTIYPIRHGYAKYLKTHTIQYVPNSKSLIIREMQVKTTMRYHNVTCQIAVIKKTRNSKCWQGCGEKGTFMHC